MLSESLYLAENSNSCLILTSPPLTLQVNFVQESAGDFILRVKHYNKKYECDESLGVHLIYLEV